MKIIIIHENLEQPYDEGMKNVVASFIRYCNKKHKTISLTNRKNNDPILKIRYQSMNLLFINPNLILRIKKFKPDKIFYFPHSSTTFFAFLRCKILEFCTNKRVVCISLQRRKYQFPFNYLIRLVKPNLILTASMEYSNYLKKNGFNVKLIPIGIDTKKFSPINKAKKNELRKKYNIPQNKQVFLHMGHLKKTRGIDKLLKITENKNNILVLVTSTTYSKDYMVPKRDNLILITKYVKDIEELYQLADCYLFLTKKFMGCIDVPLSVLEAMSCNIPVITTHFGGLKWMFKSDKQLVFIEEINKLAEKMKVINFKLKSNNRSKIKKYDLNKTFSEIGV